MLTRAAFGFFAALGLLTLHSSSAAAAKLPVAPATSAAKGVDVECFQPNVPLFHAGLKYLIEEQMGAQGLRSPWVGIDLKIQDEGNTKISQADALRGISIFREESKPAGAKFSLKYSVQVDPQQAKLPPCTTAVEFKVDTNSWDTEFTTKAQTMQIPGFFDADFLHPIFSAPPDTASAQLTCITPSKALYERAIEQSIERDLAKRKVPMYLSKITATLTALAPDIQMFSAAELSTGMSYTGSETITNGKRYFGYTLTLDNPAANSFGCLAQYELSLRVESSAKGKSGRSYFRTNVTLPGVYMLADTE